MLKVNISSLCGRWGEKRLMIKQRFNHKALCLVLSLGNEYG